ncbi:MAG: type IV secretion system protein [Alphaproteobacteria bacterium]|nr:type IV secretion system protein [Alphaproteobacteria bacterium]
MVQLGNGTKKILITDTKRKVDVGYQPHFIKDVRQEKTSNKEIYFRWLSRLVIFCTIVSLTFFLCSTLVIFRLAREIVVEPLLIINQKDSETTVRYEPIDKKMSSEKQLTEMYVRQYIIMRNTVINDEQEMRTRWGPGGIVQYMSAPDVYKEFVGMNAASIEKMFDNGYSSEVYIDKIGKESENSPVWSVKFTVYNLSRARNDTGALTLKSVRYNASVTPVYLEERRLLKARLLNPIGFTVIKYSQSEIRE